MSQKNTHPGPEILADLGIKVYPTASHPGISAIDIVTAALVASLRKRADWFRDHQKDFLDLQQTCGDTEDAAATAAKKADVYGIDASEINLREVAAEIVDALKNSG